MIRLWELGKQLGARYGDEGKILVSLEELERRDRILKTEREGGVIWVINENSIYECEGVQELCEVEIY